MYFLLFLYVEKCEVKHFFFFLKCMLLTFSFFSKAGMLAVRENRYIVLAKDFEKAYKTVIKKDEQEHEFYK